MTKTLVLNETINIDSIAWIALLPDDELGPTNRIIDDLEPLAKRNGLGFTFFTIRCRNDFLALLEKIRNEVEKGARPIIHIDAHGSRNMGLSMPDGSCVKWNELSEIMKSINCACDNELFVFYATCFAARTALSVELSSTSPYCAMVAPIDVVTVGDLEDKTVEFYQNAIESMDFSNAIKNQLPKRFLYYHSQGIFLHSIATYVNNHCAPKARTLRAGSIVARSQVGQSGTRQNRRAAKRHAVKRLVPGQHIIDHYAPSFLCGNPPQFTYNDVLRVARALKRRP